MNAHPAAKFRWVALTLKLFLFMLIPMSTSLWFRRKISFSSTVAKSNSLDDPSFLGLNERSPSTPRAGVSSEAGSQFRKMCTVVETVSEYDSLKDLPENYREAFESYMCRK